MILKPQKGTLLNRGHMLAKGLVGAWVMNEGGGNIIHDYSGNRTATLGARGISPVQWVTGKHGPAARFVCTDRFALNYISFPSITFRSIVLWIKKSSTQVIDRNPYLIDARTGISTGYIYKTGVGADWSSNLYVNLNIVANPLISLPDDEWAMVYLELKTIGTDDVTLFSRYNLEDGFSCDISHVLFYNRALSPSEIAELYRNPFGMFEEDGLL